MELITTSLMIEILQTLLMTIVLPLVIYYMNKLINKIKEPRPREILGELDDIVEDIVAAAFQEIVKPLKKQNKFGDLEKGAVRESTIKNIFTNKKAYPIIQEQNLTQRDIECKIEKFVSKMNPSNK